MNLRIGRGLRELIVCNKADLEGTEERMGILREKMQEFERTVLVPICAKDGLGLGKVIDVLERQVEDARVEEKKAQEEQIARERADRIGYEPETIYH